MAYKSKTRKTIQQTIRKRVYARDKYICGYCGKRRKPTSLAVDHIIPVAYGGSNVMGNFVTACKKTCNRKKWMYMPRENGVPKLSWQSGRQVAKITLMAKGKNFPKRIPKISYKK